MALVAKPKTKSYQRKRQAQHHRRSKHYVKAYMPYLPMVGIVAGGGLINEVWNVGSAAALASPASPITTTRLATVTGSHSATPVYIVLAITFTAFAIFVLSHWYRVHRLLNRGEAFMVRHPWFDVGLVFVITAGVVLTRQS